MPFSFSVDIMTITEPWVESPYYRVGLRKESRQNYRECCRETGMSSSKADTGLSAVYRYRDPDGHRYLFRMCTFLSRAIHTITHVLDHEAPATENRLLVLLQSRWSLQQGRLWTKKLRSLMQVPEGCNKGEGARGHP